MVKKKKKKPLPFYFSLCLSVCFCHSLSLSSFFPSFFNLIILCLRQSELDAQASHVSLTASEQQEARKVALAIRALLDDAVVPRMLHFTRSLDSTLDTWLEGSMRKREEI